VLSDSTNALSAAREIAHGFMRGQLAHCLSSKLLHLTLLPTEHCNFRCVYCYEDFAHGRMPSAVIEGVNHLIRVRAPELEELTLSWFGGEPLLALPVIRQILAAAQPLSKEYGFLLHGGFTTNGYLLTPDVLTEMVDYGQTFYQISLDGEQTQHDKTRLRADGRGTFDVIWNNLLAVRGVDRNFNIQLRVHLSDQNDASLRMLMPQIREAFGADSRFRVDFQPIRKMGGAGSANVRPLADPTIREMTCQLRALLSGSPSAAPTAAEIETPAIRTTERGDSGILGNAICYAGKPNHWLIRANGQLGRCTVLLDDPRNNLGHLGQDGTLHIDNHLLTPWFEGFRDLDPDLMACPAIGLPALPQKRVIAIAAA